MWADLPPRNCRGRPYAAAGADCSSAAVRARFQESSTRRSNLQRAGKRSIRHRRTPQPPWRALSRPARDDRPSRRRRGARRSLTRDLGAGRAKRGQGPGGEGGIRTHGRLAPTEVFKTSALSLSATSPNKSWHAVGTSGIFLADSLVFSVSKLTIDSSFQDRCLKPLGHPSIRLKSLASPKSTLTRKTPSATLLLPKRLRSVYSRADRGVNSGRGVLLHAGRTWL